MKHQFVKYKMWTSPWEGGKLKVDACGQGWLFCVDVLNVWMIPYL